MNRAIVAAVLASALATTAHARANGRFPEANHVFFSPSADEIVLRTSFGLLRSDDRGAHWSFVCEQSLGVVGTEDPMLASMPHDTMIATTFGGLRVTHDRGCDWAYAAGALGRQQLVDLAQTANAPARAVLLASSADQSADATAAFRTRLYETTDGGATFHELGVVLDATLLATTVDVGASDPARLYVGAMRDPWTAPRAFVLTSGDNGQTWSETAVPLAPGEKAIYVAGIDADDAARVWVRTSRAGDGPTRLLFSKDAGKTFDEAFVGRGPLRGFALSADGRTVYVGGPKDGLHAAAARGALSSFTALAPDLAVQCLAAAHDGLWVCSNEASGFVLAVTANEGASFEKKLHFCDVVGVPSCAATSSTATACPAAWSAQRKTLSCPELGPQDGGAAATESPRLVGGGGCATARGSSYSTAALAFAFAFAGLLVRIAARRRRRR